ncbi:MAG: YybH family protein [Rheinheimera sp.]
MKQAHSILTALFLCTLSVQSLAHDNQVKEQPVDRAVYQSAAGQVVAKFQQALQQGDSALVLAQLATEVQIFEGGGVERSRAEYAAHHLAADISYLGKISSTLLEQQIEVVGDIAYAISRSRQQGEVKGKKIDRTSIESLILRQVNGQWQIVQVHWS